MKWMRDPCERRGAGDGRGYAPSMRRRRWLVISGSLAVIAVVALGAYLFQPWRLWTTTVVDDALPPASAQTPATPATSPPAESSPTPGDPTPEPVAPAGPVDLASGAFITHEHATSGSVRIVEQPDGSRVLAIENLDTSDGPDLRVWLSDQPVIEGTAGWGVFDDGRWVELGALKGNVGNQVYEIPADVELSPYTSVSIWCARFAVSFGAASLTYL